jgi:hypothetical protein
MTNAKLVDFGARRALFDTPETRRSQAAVFALPIAGIIRLTTPRPKADVATRRIVLGRKSITFDQIDTARLEVIPGFQRQLGIRFGVTGSIQVVVVLRVGERLILTSAQRGVVLDMLDESHITMPDSKFDPTGNFARWNFPTNLTKQQAVEVVVNPPGLRDAIPIPPTW